jgi:hypothetical protein
MIAVSPEKRVLVPRPRLHEGDKISSFRNYFDDASLLEQMLVA